MLPNDSQRVSIEETLNKYIPTITTMLVLLASFADCVSGADVVFALTMSRDVSGPEFQLLKSFLIAVVSSADVGGQMLFGVVMFTNTIEQHIDLNQYTNRLSFYTTWPLCLQFNSTRMQCFLLVCKVTGFFEAVFEAMTNVQSIRCSVLCIC